MTTDSFLTELCDDWRRQDAHLGQLQRHIQRRRNRTWGTLIVKSVGTLLGFLAAGYFVWLALNGAPAIFVLAGSVLLVALPFMVLECAGTARSLHSTHAETPAELLRRARDQAAAARQLLWGPRVASALLALSAAGLLLLYAVGQATAEEALLFAPLWGAIALMAWVWQSYRRRMLAAEIESCDLLLADFDRA